MALPTKDEDVRTMLRSLEHPITLFGEDRADRRERLRKLLADEGLFEGKVPARKEMIGGGALVLIHRLID